MTTLLSFYSQFNIISIPPLLVYVYLFLMKFLAGNRLLGLVFGSTQAVFFNEKSVSFLEKLRSFMFMIIIKIYILIPSHFVVFILLVTAIYVHFFLSYSSQRLYDYLTNDFWPFPNSHLFTYSSSEVHSFFCALILMSFGFLFCA